MGNCATARWATTAAAADDAYDKYLGLPSLSERAESAVVAGPRRRAKKVEKTSGAPST